jgi:phosphatidylserine/phosphatidylglycerophosphate/cardiolipin synthase-like enzyme
MEGAILAEVAKAKTSIDVATYMFTSDDIADGLISAKNRGVSVRVIFDGGQAHNVPNTVDGKLKAAGVDVKLVSTPGTGGGIKFHHKFCVIDASVTITGSYNWTVDADETNYENLVVVRDANVSAAYAKEFDSIFTQGKGGVGSTNDIVFAPTGAQKAIEKRIAAELAKAKTEIVCAMYLFTSTDLSKAMVDALQRGVKVSFLFDARQEKVYKDKYTLFKNAGADIKLVTLGGSGAHTQDFHHKFCVIDGQTVVTGSFNYTVNQDKTGYENIIVINDATTAKAYIKAFSDAWSSPVAHP